MDWGVHVVQHPARRENAKWKNSSPIGPGTSGILGLIGKRDVRSRQGGCDFVFFSLYLRLVQVDNLIIPNLEFPESLQSDFATGGRPLSGIYWRSSLSDPAPCTKMTRMIDCRPFLFALRRPGPRNSVPPSGYLGDVYFITRSEWQENDQTRHPVESRPSPRLVRCREPCRTLRFHWYTSRSVQHCLSFRTPQKGAQRASRTAIRRWLFVGSRTWTVAVASRAGRNQGKICGRTRRASYAGKSLS